MSGASHAEVLCYEDNNQAFDRSFGDTGPKLRAVLSTLKRDHPADVLLVWQIGLLKLLPFLRRRPKKVVLFLHGVEAWKQHDWLTARLINRVDLFLSNSDYTWDGYLSINPSLSTAGHQTIQLGLDEPLNSQTPPDQTPAALMISRLSTAEDYKGHREVLNAWPLVLGRSPQATLWIAGDGDLRPELERLANDRGIGDKVVFLGRVSEEQKQELLQRSRCLVMPSRGEGFGLVYLEAMRLGRPCLVSTVDAGREVVNPPEAGLAADPDNQEELADALSRLLADGSGWSQWSRQARRRYEQNYTAKHFQDRLLAALFPNQE